MSEQQKADSAVSRKSGERNPALEGEKSSKAYHEDAKNDQRTAEQQHQEGDREPAEEKASTDVLPRHKDKLK